MEGTRVCEVGVESIRSEAVRIWAMVCAFCGWFEWVGSSGGWWFVLWSFGRGEIVSYGGARGYRLRVGGKCFVKDSWNVLPLPGRYGISVKLGWTRDPFRWFDLHRLHCHQSIHYGDASKIKLQLSKLWEYECIQAHC